MKKFLSIICASSILLLFAACNSGTNKPDVQTIEANTSTTAEIKPDKATYNFGDLAEITVSLPVGNVSKCTLVVAPHYISLGDTNKLLEESVYTKNNLTVSEKLSVKIDDKFSAGNYEMVLLAENQPVAECPISIEDNNSKFGVPSDVKFANSYIATDPADIYISNLEISCTKSTQVSALADSSKVSYEYRIRIDNGDWSEPIKIKDKYVKASDDGKEDKITLLKLSKCKKGIKDIEKNKDYAKIYEVLKDAIDVTAPIPGEFDLGRPYIDTTKHFVQVELRYFSEDNENHWVVPISIGKTAN